MEVKGPSDQMVAVTSEGKVVRSERKVVRSERKVVM